MNFLDKEGLRILWANILDKINANKTIIDTTLTQENQAADAKAVGDALSIFPIPTSEDKGQALTSKADGSYELSKVFSTEPQNYEDSGSYVKTELFTNIPISAITTFEPHQEGSDENNRPISGYDSISLTHTGKNLLKQRTFNNLTHNGITFTQQADGGIMVSGTASANAFCNLSFVADATTATFSYPVETLTASATEKITTLAIIAQPKNMTVYTGSEAVFSVKATGEGLTYQWKYRYSESATWTDSGKDGAKTDTLRFVAEDYHNGYDYCCVITDANGTSVASESAKLIIAPIVVSQQPDDQTVTEGGTAVFTVAAEGEGLTYQWQWRANSTANWGNTTVTGNQTNSITVEAAISRNGYQYRCLITDANGNTKLSNAVTLIIESQTTPITITSQPTNIIAVLGNEAVFTVIAEGEGLTYQWEWRANSDTDWSNTTVTGNQTNSITVEATTGRNGYQYRCLIKDANGYGKLSNAATLIVKEQTNETLVLAFGGWDESGATVSKGLVSNNESLTFEGNGELARIYLMVYSGATVNTVVYPQLELDSKATSYEPYIYREYNSIFSETVYGGSYNWETGALTVDRKLITINGETTIDASLTGDHGYRIQRYYLSDIKLPVDGNTPNEGLICDRLKTVSSNGNYDKFPDSIATPPKTASVQICISGFTTKAQYTEWLNANPLTIVYPLATPYTIQLTPQQIKSLNGTNILFSNPGITQISGRQDIGAALSNIDVQDEIYIGSDELPEGYTLQINPDGDAVALASVPYPATEDIGKFLRVSDIGTYALNEITMAEEVSF